MDDGLTVHDAMVRSRHEVKVLAGTLEVSPGLLDAWSGSGRPVSGADLDPDDPAVMTRPAPGVTLRVVMHMRVQSVHDDGTVVLRPVEVVG